MQFYEHLIIRTQEALDSNTVCSFIDNFNKKNPNDVIKVQI